MEKDLGYRRIQRTGRGSYLISLPKEWVSETGLEKGDQLAFQVQGDSSLLLVPRTVLERREKTSLVPKEHIVRITGNDDPESIARRIMSLYVTSTDLIRIRYRDEEITPQQKRAIENTARMLLGSEIISETSQGINIQVLIDHPQFPIEKAVRRMFAIATIMDKNAISALEELDEDLIQSVLASDQDLDRLNLYIIRQLKYGVEFNLYEEMGFSSPREFLGYRIVTKNLENVGDNAVGTVKNILALKELMNKQVLLMDDPVDEEVYAGLLKFNSFCRRLLDDSLKALFKRDYQLADNIMSQFMSNGLKMEKETVNLMLYKMSDPNVTSVLRLMMDNARKMMEYARDIAEVTLNRTVEDLETQLPGH